MERWQKIERFLSEWFRSQLFYVHQQGDVFAKYGDPEDDEVDCDFELNLTALAKEIDSEIGYDAKKDFSNSIDACYDDIKNRVAAGGPGWERKTEPRAETEATKIPQPPPDWTQI